MSVLTSVSHMAVSPLSPGGRARPAARRTFRCERPTSTLTRPACPPCCPPSTDCGRDQGRRPPERLVRLVDQAADDLIHRQHLADQSRTLPREGHIVVEA